MTYSLKISEKNRSPDKICSKVDIIMIKNMLTYDRSCHKNTYICNGPIFCVITQCNIKIKMWVYYIKIQQDKLNK